MAPPSGIVLITALDSVATWVTVPERGFATHTLPSPTATSPAPAPTSIDPRAGFEPARTRQSVPSEGDVTHAASEPTAMSATDVAGTRVRATTLPLVSSRRATEPSMPSAQTPAGPVATAWTGKGLATFVTAVLAASIRASEESGPTAHSASSEAAR